MSIDEGRKILVVDDHEVVRSGIVHILQSEKDMEISEAEDGKQALEKFSSEKFDLVILDISLPELGGLEVLKEMQQIDRDTPVLILSIHPEEQYAFRAIKAGASGYITKASATSELKEAVKTILGGRRYITTSLAEKLALMLDKDMSMQPHQKLSEREFQVFRLIAGGKSMSDIADDLSLSIKTVSTYKSRILEKMEMSTASELIRYAIENKFV